MVSVVDVNPAHSLAQEHVQAQLSNLLDDQAPGIAIQLPRQYPSISFDQFDFTKLFEIHHRLGRLQPEQTTTDHGTRRTLDRFRELDQLLQIFNGPVHEDALRVVSRRMSWQDRVRASGQHEDIIGNGITLRGHDNLMLRVDLSDHGVKVIVERARRQIGVLHQFSSRVLSMYTVYHTHSLVFK